MGDQATAGSRQVAQGVCYGYAVRSALTFSYLRPGTGQDLWIERSRRTEPAPEGPPLLSFTPTVARPYHARLWGGEGRYDYWVEGVGWFHIDAPRSRITVPATGDAVTIEERVWGMPAVLCFSARGDVPLHAAAVEVEGGAILLSAPGRFGKTTLAGAFLDAGYRLLSEDTACCRIAQDPVLLPGPAMLRLRPDVYSKVKFTGAEPILRDGSRVHLAVDADRRGTGAPVPIAAIIFVHPHADQCALTPVRPTEALPDVWAMTFRLPRESEQVARFPKVVDLVGRVPMWCLFRPHGLDRLPEVVQHVVRRCA